MDATKLNQENEKKEKSKSMMYFIEKVGMAAIRLVQGIIPPVKKFNEEMDEIDNNEEPTKPELKVTK